MFNFSYSFIISPSLLKLIFAIAYALGKRGVAIARCEWVKDPYIKKCTLPIAAPKFSATMSRRAPSSLFADLRISLSSVTGCGQGSVPGTPWHISVKNSAVISLISLCRIDGNPPREQLRACSTVNYWSQTHREGSCSGHQLYLRHKASQKAPL